MALGSFVGRLMGRFIPVRKKVVRENLRQAFPDLSSQGLSSLIVKTYRQFILLIVEFIHFDKFRKSRISDVIAGIEGEEHYKRLSGKPFIVLTAHIGNWELMGAYFTSRGESLTVLAKPLHNPFINQMIVKIRSRAGLEIISTRESNPLKPVLKALKTGRCVCFLADQDARKSGIFVNFFNKPASTFTGPALFSIRTGLPILPVFDVRLEDNRHKIIFHPPIMPQENSLNRNQAMREITQAHARILENMIRKYPDQYFWFHRRWKSKPVK